MSDDSGDAAPRVNPDWPTCATDVCVGRQIEGFEHCLAHLRADELDDVLRSFTPGADVDLRGTTLTDELLDLLLARLTEDSADPTGRPRFGRADFRYCLFRGEDVSKHVRFVGVQFGGDAWFDDAQFDEGAWFGGAQFGGYARFVRTKFGEDTRFGDARFGGDAWFDDAKFGEGAWFGGVQFDGYARFGDAEFDGYAGFGSAQFDGDARFGSVRFGGNAWFGRTKFGGGAWFEGAQFGGGAWFGGAKFGGDTRFDDAKFGGGTRFDDAKFGGDTRFEGAQFGGDAGFGRTKFGGDAGFGRTKFGGDAGFDVAQFGGDARFEGARFESVARFGPLLAKTVGVDGASFAKRAVVEVDADGLSVVDTRFEGGVELRVRRAAISLRRTNFGAPSSVSGTPSTFVPLAPVGGTEVMRGFYDVRPAGLEVWVPRLLSVQETDVSQLTLADVDLRWCRFAGAHHLDKLSLEGRSPFNRPPHRWQVGWAWPPVWRWTARRVLAEEHPWRAGRRKSGGWSEQFPGFGDAAGDRQVGPERLAVLYRSLRKAFEDAKNEAGAGDFYYGEMEARRHAPSASRAERALLTAYWLVSGYGQRATRALAGVVMLIALLFALLTHYGLPDNTALQQMTGTIPAAVAGQSQQITFETKPAPTTLPPPDQRWTADRMGKAIRIALGSVVFRDADQKLTPTGVWTVMAGRAFGPLLLALAALAIRARVKR